MSDYFENILNPLRTPFTIAEDGTSQTKLSNHGRLGFYVERLFGVNPNNDRGPDLGKIEIKTMQEGKKVSIGTMPESEFQIIKKANVHLFELSDPYDKMKNTIVIVYQKSGHYPPVYKMKGWGMLDLTTMSDTTKQILQDDYAFICKHIAGRCDTRDGVTNLLMRNGSISGNYLSLGYKGQGSYGYNYPSWSFQASFMNKLIHA